MATPFIIRAIEFRQETAFGEGGTGDFTRLSLPEVPVVNLELEKLAGGRPFSLSNPVGIPSKRKATFSLDFYLCSSGTAAINGVAAVDPEYLAFFKAEGFKKFKDTNQEGSGVTAGAATSITVSTGEGAHWAEGMGVGCKKSAADFDELNFVESITDDAITVTQAWASNPENGDNAFNGVSMYLPKTQTDLAALPSFEFQIYTADALYVLKGVKSKIKSIIAENHSPIKMSVDFEAEDFSDPIAVSTSEPETYIGTAFPKTLPVEHSAFRYNEVAEAAGKIEIDFGVTKVLRADIRGVIGTDGEYITAIEPVIKANTYFSATKITDAITPTTRAVFLQIGATAGNIFGIFIPVAEIDVPVNVEVDGLNVYELTIKPRESSVYKGNLIICFA